MDRNMNRDAHQNKFEERVLKVPTHHNTQTISERVILPLPPTMGQDTRFEMEVYARFMRHMRSVPHSRMEIKILSSIQFTADMMDTSDALITKTLADLGLRAPRRAFPVTFLDFVDKSVMRMNRDTGTPPPSVVKLHSHWKKIGEDCLSPLFSGHHSLYENTIYANA